ncbi:SGNH/GDSL hydrolase family protein [Bacillaceae bacterium Marseille-Q3522]|nr:SGNH/GDSL hydrolase family protein [Bacillaceae bacterium Marseille-Q3522]
MKNAIAVILAIACAGLLVFGHLTWKDRTAVSPQPGTAAPSGGNAAAPDGTNGENTAEPALTLEESRHFTKNWLAQARQSFETKLLNGNPYKIAVVGSNALGTNDAGLAQVFREQLQSVFKEAIEVPILTYDMTSTEYVESGNLDALVQEAADFLILEPFILKDNGPVTLDETLANLDTIVNTVMEAKPDTVIALQSSYPLYNTSFYLQQEAALQEYATQKKLLYFDHWTAWPDTKDPALDGYVTPNRDAPNEQGIAVWSAYLLDFFVSK